MISLFIYLFVYLFICIWGAKFIPIYLVKQNSYSHNRKENNRRFPPEIITSVFIISPHHTIHKLTHSLISVTRLLALLTQFRYLPLTVFPFKPLCMQPLLPIANGFWRYADSLNSRRNLLNCPQLTPAIALSLVHSCQQKSIGLKFSKSQTGSDVRYSCHHNSSRFTFPIFAHSCRFSVLRSLQSVTPRIY